MLGRTKNFAPFIAANMYRDDRAALPYGVPPPFVLENALGGRQWTHSTFETFLGVRSNQQIRGLEDQKKIFCVALSTMMCSGN